MRLSGEGTENGALKFSYVEYLRSGWKCRGFWGELMACGDSPNDGAMIRMAEIGVAMGNADDAVKEMADYVTGTNAEDGVAVAIEKFVLGESI